MSKDIPQVYFSESKQETNPQINNINAAKLVADTIRTTLGPKGMDKLLVNSLNQITITNDGVTILDEMEISHPIAKMIVDVARAQESEVGDGTTTAVILAGELLDKAKELIKRNIHPTMITKGYRLALSKSTEVLNKLAIPLEDNKETLIKIVSTAMTGKGAELAKEKLSEIVVEAVNNSDAKENIIIQKVVGDSIDNSSLVKGIILDKHRVHPDMPTKQDDAKIALLNCPIEMRDTETDAKISITSPEQMQSYLSQEEDIIKGMVSKIIDSKANVVFCQKGIDDLAQYFLAKAGVIAVRRMKQSDMNAIAKSTGAKIVYDIKDLDESKLGKAKVEEIKLNENTMLQISNIKNASTILVTGNTEHVAEEMVRAVEDAVGDLYSVLKSKKILPGAGAIEIELSNALNDYAKSLSGREQLAVNAFASSLHIIPKTLAENAGLDPIDVIAELNAAHDKSMNYGIDVFSGSPIDALKEGIIEPINVKLKALSSATEVANMILRIDDVIAMPGEREPPGPRVRMPGMEY